MAEKIRTIHELLILLKENIINYNLNLTHNTIEAGLCYEVNCMRETTIAEDYRILDYISKNKPKYKIPEDVDCTFRHFEKSSFGWMPTQWEPRLEWLNKHIELTSKLKT